MWHVPRHRSLQGSVHKVVIRRSGTEFNTPWSWKYQNGQICVKNMMHTYIIWYWLCTASLTKNGNVYWITPQGWEVQGIHVRRMRRKRQQVRRAIENYRQSIKEVHCNLHRFSGSALRRNARRFALSTTRCRFREIRPLSRGRPFANRKVHPLLLYILGLFLAKNLHI